MTFPRLAIHTGTQDVVTNKHQSWQGSIVIQHNETTATILKYGPNMTNGAKKRHPLLSTFQSNCQRDYWQDYTGELLGTEIVNGQPAVADGVIEVLETVPALGV